MFADGGIRRGDDIAVGGVGIGRPWWGGNGGRLLAFDVTTPAAPVFVSELNLTTNTWWSFSTPSATAGLVYISHQASEFVEGVTLPNQPQPLPTVTVDKETGVTITNVVPVGVWVQRYYLDVVDYADPKLPTMRTPVNIPGQLNGLSHDGALIYTVGAHWKDWNTDWAEWLDASAYDGVAASLVDSLPLPNDWPHPLLVSEATIYLGRPNSGAETGELETWRLAETGKFTKTASVKLGSAASVMAQFGKVLVVQQNSGTVLFDATDPAGLVVVGKSPAQGCYWFDLSRADASREQGLWVPLGDYGVTQVGVSP
jgi:hypothetical protein